MPAEPARSPVAAGPEAGGTTVAEAVALFLEACGVELAFGVISIHNMPILDALARRGRIRFVPARGEAGAANMADGAARVSGRLGVVVTSTGTAAGNAAGALIEAAAASTPLLHLTGQIELAYIDRNRGYLHEARDQLAMLKAVSKAAFRVWSPAAALPTLKEAVRIALTPPCGPVSVEFPIDLQDAPVEGAVDVSPHPAAAPRPDPERLDRLAERLSRARRPLLWLGGGARGAAAAVARLVDMGFGVVTSTQGRGILPEDHPATLGAFTAAAPVEAFFGTCDAILVAGSRLRTNETLKHSLRLPAPLYQIDADTQAEGRAYPADMFVLGDCAPALAGLAERLDGRLDVDPAFHGDLAAAREAAVAELRRDLGPYAALVDGLQAALGRDFVWVRDVTVSNSTWGNRLLRIFSPRDGVHALGGGIGQGLPMAIGAALAAPGRRTVCLAGDGGLQLSLGEIATLAEERPDVLLLVMNSGGYQVIRNIQDARFDGRRHYVDLAPPDFGGVFAAHGIPCRRIESLDGMERVLAEALRTPGPVAVEVDMDRIGPFARPFAGPPARR